MKRYITKRYIWNLMGIIKCNGRSSWRKNPRSCNSLSNIKLTPSGSGLEKNKTSLGFCRTLQIHAYLGQSISLSRIQRAYFSGFFGRGSNNDRHDGNRSGSWYGDTGRREKSKVEMRLIRSYLLDLKKWYFPLIFFLKKSQHLY